MERNYKLDKRIYMETIWYIRLYPTLKADYEHCIGSSPDQDGQPHGSGVGDPTSRDAARRLEKYRKIEPIEKALKRIPEEYRQGILDNIILRNDYPVYANPKTWKRWKRRFVYHVAKERGYDV